jgi:hypothetical protein
VGGDVPVDSEAPVVTSSISRPDLSAQSFRDAYRGRVCMRAFIEVSVRTEPAKSGALCKTLN